MEYTVYMIHAALYNSSYLNWNKPICVIRSLWILWHHVRPKYKSLSRVWVPLSCVHLITSGTAVQSSKSCIMRAWSPACKVVVIMFDKSLFSVETLWHSLIVFSRVVLRAEQWRRRCSKEPNDLGEQAGRRQSPDVFRVQCLWSWSVKYLPEIILQTVTALLHSQELGPQDDQIGCGRQRDMKPGLKYGAEVSDAAFVRRWTSQWSTMWDFTSLLKVGGFGGSCRRDNGWGSW